MRDFLAPADASTGFNEQWGDNEAMSRSQPSAKAPVTAGHHRVVPWMETEAFPELVRLHEAALGGRATVYFRPTDKGIVRIVLHPSAPGYVGFRTAHNDNGYLVRPGSPVPTLEALRSQFAAFEAWLPSVARGSSEERGVMPWIRAALQQHLRLPALGHGWVFLHHEWRFSSGTKSPVLAVHAPTGQLGIVELKSQSSDLANARKQVEDYAAHWRRDAHLLAPHYTRLLRALGRAYHNDEAVRSTVTTAPAALFVGTASESRPVQIVRHQTSGR
jgi:hypothetical protein